MSLFIADDDNASIHYTLEGGFFVRRAVEQKQNNIRQYFADGDDRTQAPSHLAKTTLAMRLWCTTRNGSYVGRGAQGARSRTSMDGFAFANTKKKTLKKHDLQEEKNSVPEDFSTHNKTASSTFLGGVCAFPCPVVQSLSYRYTVTHALLILLSCFFA